MQNTDLDIQAFVKIAVNVSQAHKMVRFIQAMGGEVLNVEKHEHFDYDTYTVRAIIPTA